MGTAYLGVQGDVFDAQKDIALAGLGATLAMTATALINIRLQKNFVDEWADSFTVKQKEPLGEEAIAKMLATKDAGDSNNQ
jgi:putative membrane protein